MNKLLQYGQIIFGTGFIGLAVLCLITPDFIVGRPPVWQTSGLNPALGYASAVLLTAMAILIIIDKKGAMAAIIIALMILFLSVPRHAVQFMNDWGNAYKTLALLGGTLIILVSFLDKDGNLTSSIKLSVTMRKWMVFAGCVMIAAFFLSGGYAHFKFAEFVNNFIPEYIPFRPFWTYFCGICLIGGGIGILIPQTRRLAALLSGIMVLGWFLLLHIPRFIANTNDVSDRLGLCESFIFAGIFFVLAEVSARKNYSAT
jgi:uncharacterized membrane protein